LKKDPRFLNVIIDGDDIGQYLEGYAEQLKQAINTVDKAQLQLAYLAIEGVAAAGGKIYAIGNGGSSSIADHLCCDWTKGTHVRGAPSLSSFSLSANVALYSAIANDYGFENVFSTQVEFHTRPGDLIIAISSSGNSPNIIHAVNKAKALGVKTIGMSGFKGGELAAAADVSLYVDANNYGIVEDAHQALVHILAQFIAKCRDGAVT
jgi:phosphoheptose isomerase